MTVRHGSTSRRSASIFAALVVWREAFGDQPQYINVEAGRRSARGWAGAGGARASNAAEVATHEMRRESECMGFPSERGLWARGVGSQDALRVGRAHPFD